MEFGMTYEQGQFTLLSQALRSDSIETTQTIPIPRLTRQQLTMLTKKSFKPLEDGPKASISQFSYILAILLIVVGTMFIASGIIGAITAPTENRSYDCAWVDIPDVDYICSWK